MEGSLPHQELPRLEHSLTSVSSLLPPKPHVAPHVLQLQRLPSPPPSMALLPTASPTKAPWPSPLLLPAGLLSSAKASPTPSPVSPTWVSVSEPKGKARPVWSVWEALGVVGGGPGKGPRAPPGVTTPPPHLPPAEPAPDSLTNICQSSGDEPGPRSRGGRGSQAEQGWAPHVGAHTVSPRGCAGRGRTPAP